jgi:hypothetical protein
MDCSLIQARLIGYHFATLDDAEQRAVEDHIVACDACLRTYLALKGHVDRGAHGAQGPSEEARLRLRAAVEARFRATPARRLRRWLTRPVPLYQGLAVASVVLAAAAIAPSVAHAFHRASAARSAERVDTTREAARSTSIY